jgi:hypothetical protein
MDNPIYPYGPSPNKLEKLIASIASRRKEQVTLDLLEKNGVPKTQVSVAFSGLKQLGFVNSDGSITELTLLFSKNSSKKQASNQILQNVYCLLTNEVEKNPATSQIAANSFLQRLGRGESAREKILKMFWYFWKLADRKSIPTDLHSVDISKPESSFNEIITITTTSDGNNSSNLSKEINIEADNEAIQLANSLTSFYHSRGKLLSDKKRQLSLLQQECKLQEEELQRVRKILEQHLLMYPNLTEFIKID